jgi:Zn-dependent protease/CBS domain-containing protein
MTGGVTLFRVGGIPVRVHPSWLVIFGLIAWSLSVGYFPNVLPDASVGSYWIQGLAAALLLFVSVFLHELGHAVVARAHGIPVSSITLHIFGGVSSLEREPDRPGTEFKVAIVGPIVSFVLGGLAYLGARLATAQPGLAAVLTYLAIVNIVVGAFNLVPGFPLDGGRLLRALLWKAKGSLRWATEIATGAGSVVAFVLIGLGVLRALSGQFLGGLWLVLIGMFLRQAAQGSYQDLLVRRALGGVTVRDVMSRDVISIGPGALVSDVVDGLFWRHHVSSFPVVEDGRVLGVLGIGDVRDLPRERWPETRAREIMRPIGEGLTIEPGAALTVALPKLSSNGLGRLAVVQGAMLVGYLSLKDVLHAFTVKTAGGLDGGGDRAAARPRHAAAGAASREGDRLAPHRAPTGEQ